jgi:hypothetical protein
MSIEIEIAGIFDQRIFVEKLINEWNGSTDSKDMIGFYTNQDGFIVAATHVAKDYPAHKSVEVKDVVKHVGIIDKAICRVKPSVVMVLFGENYREIHATLEEQVNDLSKVRKNFLVDSNMLDRMDNATSQKDKTKLRIECLKKSGLSDHVNFGGIKLPQY